MSVAAGGSPVDGYRVVAEAVSGPMGCPSPCDDWTVGALP
jgi:hypothetical protein